MILVVESWESSIQIHGDALFSIGTVQPGKSTLGITERESIGNNYR